MNKGKFKTILKGLASVTAIAALAVGLTACSNGGGSGKQTITFINQRTDLKQDGTWDRYVKEFQKAHPNIQVKVQALNDYATNMKTRMNSNNYGDVFMIPDSVTAKDYSHFLVPLGKVSSLSKKYYCIQTGKQYNGTAYGIASDVNVSGMIVNMNVFKKAGINKVPKTPSTFIAALKKIKSKEKGVVPLYTNYHSGFALSNWDSVGPGSTADPNFYNKIMKEKKPFAPGQTMNTVYKILYTACKDKLVEGDPTTSDWEQSKQDMADNKIGVMVLGSWALQQIQAKNKKNAKNIVYAAFPITPKSGKQYVSLSGDYALGVSAHSQHKKAAKIFVKWLVDKSSYAKDNGAIPTLKGASMPTAFQALKKNGVGLMQVAPAPKGEENLLQQVNNDSKVGFQSTEDYKQKIVDAGVGNNKQSFASIMNDMDNKWSKAVTKDVK